MTKHLEDTTHFAFEGSEDFEAFNKAEAFLRSRGFSCGSMERGQPIGILLGDYRIAKWNNLTRDEKEQLHGQISTDTSFRSGPVMVDIYDDAPKEARKAITNGNPHDLYTDSDAAAPDVIKDRNGEIVLGLCKRCGKGEVELQESCTPNARKGEKIRTAQHTQAPWRVVQTDTERLVIDQRLVRATGAIVIGNYAYKLTIEGIANEDEFLANLFLIAAAPELLYLLERAAYWFDAAHAKFGSNHSIDFAGCAKEYRHAIAKATGKEAA